MREQMVGRESEWAAISALLDTAASRAGLLVLEGESGIGKTLLLESTRDAARERGYLVLEGRSSEAESALAYRQPGTTGRAEFVAPSRPSFLVNPVSALPSAA